MKTDLQVGNNCFVRIPNDTFGGIVQELRDENWVRVMGKGSIEGTYFNEWFPINSDKVWVYPTAT